MAGMLRPLGKRYCLQTAKYPLGISFNDIPRKRGGESFDPKKASESMRIVI
jgi:hypothetical protein